VPEDWHAVGRIYEDRHSLPACLHPGLVTAQEASWGRPGDHSCQWGAISRQCTRRPGRSTAIR